MQKLRFRYDLRLLELNLPPDQNSNNWLKENYQVYTTTGVRTYYYEHYDIQPRRFASFSEWDFSLVREKRVLVKPMTLPNVLDTTLPRGLSLEEFVRQIKVVFRTRTPIEVSELFYRYAAYCDFFSMYDNKIIGQSWFLVNALYYGKYGTKPYTIIYSDIEYPPYMVPSVDPIRKSDLIVSKLPKIESDEDYVLQGCRFATIPSLVNYYDTHVINSPLVVVEKRILGGGGKGKKIIPEVMYLRECTIESHELGTSHYLAVNFRNFLRDSMKTTKTVMISYGQYKVKGLSIVIGIHSAKQICDITMMKGARVLDTNIYYDVPDDWVIVQSHGPFVIKFSGLVGVVDSGDVKISSLSTVSQIAENFKITENQAYTKVYHDEDVLKFETDKRVWFVNVCDRNINWKGSLWEYCQKHKIEYPVLTIKVSGPSHMPNFWPTIDVSGISMTLTGHFKTKRDAENNMCFVALEYLSKHCDPTKFVIEYVMDKDKIYMIERLLDD